MKKILFLFFLILFLIVFFYFYSLGQEREEKIFANIYLGQYSLRGLTKDGLENFLKEEIEDVERNGIKFIAQNDQQKKEITLYPVIIALTDPDLTRKVIEFDQTATLEEILKLKRRDFFLFRLFQKLTNQSDKRVVSLKFRTKEEEVMKILKNAFSELGVNPKNAELNLVNGQWQVTPEKEGFVFDYETGLSQLENNLKELDFSPIVLNSSVQKPTLKKEEVEAQIAKVEQFLVEFNTLNLNYGQQKWGLDKNEIKHWLTLKLELEKEGEEIKIDFKKEKISEFLIKIAQQINKEPQEAKFKMSEGRVVEFQVSREGRRLDLEKNEQKIKDYLLGGTTIREIELEISTIQPEILIADINNLGIKELVGRGDSDFVGSPKNRIHNIKIGAKTLNGLLIKLDEEFSLLKALGEVSEEVGYLPELVIKGNRTIPELGGGLCQIATTTFRVALNTGLPITQRLPHAFRVIYYEPAGVDATIYPPYPDFKFINDTGAYLLLQTKIEKTKLIFEFYGTPDGRQIEISQPKIFNVVSPPPPKYIETEELKPGEKKRVEKAVAGAETEFFRIIVWPDGQKKAEVWKSHYRPWPEVWLIGKEKEETIQPSLPEQSTP